MANLRSRNDRAIVAFLKPVVQGVDARTPIYAANSNEPRDASNMLVDVITSQGPESPPFSGCYMLDVRVRVQIPGKDQPNQPYIEQNRVRLDAMVDAIFGALSQSDTGQDYQFIAQAITDAGNTLAVDASGGVDPAGVKSAEINADMANYCCLSFFAPHYVGGMDEGTASLSFVELINFRVVAAAGNFR